MLKIITRVFFFSRSAPRAEDREGAGGWWGRRKGWGRGTGAVDGSRISLRLLCITFHHVLPPGSFLDHLMTRFFFDRVWFSRCSPNCYFNNIYCSEQTAKAFNFFLCGLRVKSNKLALTRWRHLMVANVTAITVSNVTL